MGKHGQKTYQIGHLHKGQISLGRHPQAAVVVFEREREPRAAAPPMGCMNRRLKPQMLHGGYGIVTDGWQIVCEVDLKDRADELIPRRRGTHNSPQTVGGPCVGSSSRCRTPTKGSSGV